MEHGRIRPVVVALAVALVAPLLLTAVPARAATPAAWPGQSASFAGMPRADPACDKTWDGTTGSWFDPGRWAPSGVPTDTQRPCLPDGTYTVTLPPQAASKGLTVGTGVTFVIDGGYLDARANGGTILNRGTVKLKDGAELYSNATTNEGVIEDTGTVTTVPRLVSPLENAGTLRSNLSLQVWPGSAGVITNLPGATMTTVGATSALVFVGAGTTTLNGTVTNAGTFVQSAGTLLLRAVTATGSPIVLSSPGIAARLDASGTGSAQVRATTAVHLVADIAAGFGVIVTSDAANGGNLQLDADRTNHGTLTLESVGAATDVHLSAVSGTPRLTNLGDLNVKPGGGGARFLRVQLTNGATGDVHVFPGTVLTVDTPGVGAGAYTTSGDITIDTGGAMTVSGNGADMSFTQTAGTITLGGTFEQYHGTHVHQGGTVAGGNIRLRGISTPPSLDASGPGGPTFDVFAAAKLAGDIHADASVVLRGASLELTADRTNHGLLRLDSDDASNAGLATTAGAKLTNAAGGTLEVLAGAGGTRSLGVGVVNQGAADIRVSTTVNNGGDNANPSFVNSGTVELEPGVSFQPRGGYRQTAGSTDVDAAALYVPQSPGLIDIQDGVLRGKGSLHGAVRNAGAITPGRATAPYGQFHVQSVTWQFGTLNQASYTQTAEGLLSAEINGTTPGTGHDQIKVDGPVTLAGDLEVDNAATFTPNPATPDRIRVIDAQSRTGTFTTVTGPDNDDYEVEYTAPGHVDLKAIEPGPPAAQINIEDAETTEGDAGTKNLTFTVKLNQPATSEVTAHWQTVADTATAPEDFTAVADAVVTFAPGQTQKTIDVAIAGDTAAEPIETFLVRLRNPQEARLGVARATGRILSDDFDITSVKPPRAGDEGTATLTVRGGDFVAGSTVTLRRAGSPDRVGEVVDIAADRSRILARFDLGGADLGDYDVVVTKPGAGGATVTEDDAFEVIDGVRSRIAVNVSVPGSQRYGWAGRATVSLRNEGSNDGGVEMVRVRGTDVELSLEGETEFVPGPLAIHGDELVERLGGTDVIPPGETRRFVVRFKSTTLAPHAPLRVDADVYPAGYTDGLGEDGSDPEDQGGQIGGHVRNTAGDAVAGVAVSALRANGTDHRGRFATATTRADGSFTLDGLADGTYQVAIGSDPTNADERKGVTIAAANRTPSVDLVAAVSEVVGSVRTPGGTRLANATVALLDADGGVVATTPSDAGGGFSFAVLRPGSYSLSASHPTGGLAHLGDLELAAGESRTGLRLTTGSRSLAVTVNGPGSAPVAGARVIVRAPGGEPLQLAKTTNGSGVATFTGLPAGAVPVEAHRTGFGSAKAQPSGNAHTFALVTAATVNGLIDSADGPVANAMVIAIAANGLTQRAFAGADGHYSFNTLAPGTYTFWFQSMGYAPERVTGVVVAPGEQTRNAPLDTQGNVHPLALKSAGGGFVPGALFSVRDAASGVALVTIFAGPDGVANPGPLPAGAYLVEVSIPGAAPRTSDLTVGAARHARIENTTELPPLPAVTADQPFRQHEAKYVPPYRSFWTQLEIPQLNEKDRLGWDQISVIFPRPCPAAERLYDQIQSKKRAKRTAFSAWLQAHTAISQANQQQVKEYLGKSAELGAKLYLSAVLVFEGTPAGVSGTQLAVLQAYVGGLSQYAQNQASGDSLSRTDYAEKAQEALEIVREGLKEAGSHPENSGIGNGFAALNALRDVIKLNKEVEQFSDNVRDRGEAYLYAQGQYLKVIEQINDLLNRFHAAVANCPDPDDPDPYPAPGASGGGVSDNVAPNDPNDIQGPAGVGAERWIPRAQDLGYTIRFENLGPGSEHIPPGQSPATAPAVLVTIEHVLDEDVDLDAVELGDVGWGDRLVSVPGGLQSYHEDIPQADGDTVRVDGALDKPTRTITWTLATIDPETGELETSASAGFLPPEDGSGNGQGFVAYGARGQDGLAHATQLTAKASIRFDLNPVIETPEHTNTIDAAVPVSAVSAATQPGAGTAGCQEQLAVQWGGSDSGSGVAVHDVWVSIDGLPFTPWLAGSSATSGTYPAQSGHSYAFASVARDRVGNAEALPAAGDVTSTVAECDQTAPVSAASIDGPAAKGGWYPAPVEVGLAAVDNPGGFGVTQLVWSATGATTGGATVNGDEAKVAVSQDGTTELSFHGKDAANNTSAPRKLTLRIDTKAPSIAVAAPAEGAKFTVGQAVTPQFSCTDAGAGVASCTGSGIDTSAAGERTFTVVAVDKAGHRAEVARRYTVVAPASPPGSTPTPPGTGTPPARVFRSRPVVITLQRVTSSSVRLRLRNSERFAVSGRAALRRRTGRAVPFSAAKAFRLKARGRATVVLRLNRAARRALRGGRTVRATLRLTLRSGAATKTVTKTVKLKLRRVA